jgi:hypothetical protein
MRSKLLALAVLLGGILVAARLVERRTRPDLVDEYGS